MKTLHLITLFACSLLIFSCKNDKKTTKETPKEIETPAGDTTNYTVNSLEIILTPKSESSVKGAVSFSEENGTVKMEATLSGLTEGDHAIHIHQKADCSSLDGKSTGGHWNPTMKAHGKWGAVEGYHRGDIGNFKADANGNGKVVFSTGEWCLGCEDDTKNIIGKAIIVHQGTDDYTSQPSGAAGKRVSCGGIIK